MSKSKFFRKYTELDFLNDEIAVVEAQIEEKLNIKAERADIDKARERLDKLRDQLAKL